MSPYFPRFWAIKTWAPGSRNHGLSDDNDAPNTNRRPVRCPKGWRKQIQKATQTHFDTFWPENPKTQLGHIWGDNILYLIPES